MQAYGKTNIFKTSLHVLLTRTFQKRKWSFCCQQNGESFAPQMNPGTVWIKARDSFFERVFSYFIAVFNQKQE
jgi:hypothetical protein